MLTSEVKSIMIQALRKNPLGAQNVLNEMEAGKKINAIKELRVLINPIFGLREAKEFVELYYTATGAYGASYSFKIDRARFMADINRKGKRLKLGAVSELDCADLNQIPTEALMAFRKKLNKELKSRGKKL